MLNNYLTSFKFTAILIIYTQVIFINIINGEPNCEESACIYEDCSCSKCLPGLVCNAAEICVKDESSCWSYQWTNSSWKPSCESDGTWSAKQCKGELSNGKCFCYSPTGSRIFGWAWWRNAENMTCACSRRRNELKEIRDDVSLHCAENGNYEELQCDNGLCWCVEPETGRPTQRVYPESVMTHLPCYKEENIGSQYLRQCESKHIARVDIIKKLKTHGVQFAHVEDTFCDYDGSYGHYALEKDQTAHCTWKDSSKLRNYFSPISEISSMNCHCARDTRILEDEGLEMLLICQTNGNYKLIQYDNGRPFCVDDDGFPTTPLGDFGQTINCPPAIVDQIKCNFRN